MASILKSPCLKARDEEEEPRKEPSKDYYTGYYFGNNPYTSAEELPGRKNDKELRDDVIQRLKNSL
jgi:hypothetical protein